MNADCDKSRPRLAQWEGGKKIQFFGFWGRKSPRSVHAVNDWRGKRGRHGLNQAKHFFGILWFAKFKWLISSDFKKCTGKQKASSSRTGKQVTFEAHLSLPGNREEPGTWPYSPTCSSTERVSPPPTLECIFWSSPLAQQFLIYCCPKLPTLMPTVSCCLIENPIQLTKINPQLCFSRVKGAFQSFLLATAKQKPTCLIFNMRTKYSLL